MKDEIVARIGFKGGVVEISEDVLCKHTIFIGSTGSGKTTSCNVLLRGTFQEIHSQEETGLPNVPAEFGKLIDSL